MGKKLSLRVATHALIVGLAVSSGGIGAVTFAAPAVAAPGKPTDAPKEGLTGTLTIHKKLNPTSLGTPTGKEDSGVTGDAFNGVTFKVKRLNWDVTTNEGLKTAAARTAKSVGSGDYDNSFTERTEETANDGTATFDNLPVGAYYVEEVTPVPDDAKTGAGLEAASTVTPSSPFIAFIPMTDTTDTSKWNYSVVAYPKNNSFTLKKATEDGASAIANVGDDITFDITGDRPSFDPNKQYISYYQIKDVKPKGFTYKSVEVAIGDTPLTVNDDYKVTDDNGNPVITLTVKGEQELMKSDNAGKKVVAKFTFTVNELSDTSTYERVNKGEARVQVSNRPDGDTPKNPNEPNVPNKPGGSTPEEPNPQTPPPGVPVTPSNPVPETWIPVKIKKVVAGSETVLPGATFQVYRCTAKSAVQDGAEGVIAKSENPLTVNNVTSWTTGKDGTITVKSLRLRKNRQANDGYCFKETKAPEGYELNPAPIFFRLSDSEAAKKLVKDVKIEDSKSVGPKLPSTGGMGVGLLMALGALVVGAGAVFARRSSKAKS